MNGLVVSVRLNRGITVRVYATHAGEVTRVASVVKAEAIRTQRSETLLWQPGMPMRSSLAKAAISRYRQVIA